MKFIIALIISLSLILVIKGKTINQGNCNKYLYNNNNNSTMSELDRCEFFKCIDDSNPCGEGEWMLKWGYKYCKRFHEPSFNNKFNQNGKYFLTHINSCLPEELITIYNDRIIEKNEKVTCDELTRQGFDAQGRCYQKAQRLFCQAFKENKSLFIKVLDFKDFFDVDALSLMKETTDKCEPKITLWSIIFKK
jgi:hypothetical protein